MAAFMTSTVSNGTSNRHLAGEEYDYISKEDSQERRIDTTSKEVETNEFEIEEAVADA